MSNTSLPRTWLGRNHQKVRWPRSGWLRLFFPSETRLLKTAQASTGLVVLCPTASQERWLVLRLAFMPLWALTASQPLVRAVSPRESEGKGTTGIAAGTAEGQGDRMRWGAGRAPSPDPPAAHVTSDTKATRWNSQSTGVCAVRGSTYPEDIVTTTKDNTSDWSDEEA